MDEFNVRLAIRGRGLSRKEKNSYTQGAKRTQVARGYSDCSSFVRWCFLMVLGTEIGSYTGAQVTNGNMVTIHQGGKYPDVSKLKVGQAIYFKNSTSKYTYGVSHVELVIQVGKTLSECRILGHGGGIGPTEKNLKSYCDKSTYLMTREPKKMTKTWMLGERIISLGCYGEDVRDMQFGLIKLGFSVGSYGADWDCGDATDAAIRRFQKTYGLTVDGEFGPKSLEKMNILLYAPKPIPEINPEPLTGDDYPATEPDAPTDQPTDPPTDPDDEGEVLYADWDELPNPEGDGYMGANAVNPYPIPTKIKRKGNKGPTVKWVQWELEQSGYDLGKYGIDGEFGSDTDKAVRKYQKAHNDADEKPLVVDGAVGPKTIGALQAEMGVCEHVVAPPAATDEAGRVYDVSSYDGNIDFAKLASLTGKQRCEMLIIRAQASESGTKVDIKLARNIKGCKQYGIPYGVYAYTYAAAEAAGKKDADRFYNNVMAAGGEPLCWVIDAEEGKNTKATIEAMRKQLRGHIGPQGAIWFYSFDSRVRSWSDIMVHYDGIWTARWNTPAIKPGYKDYDLWQYGYTNVPGIRKTTDTSRRHPDKSLEQILARRAG